MMQPGWAVDQERFSSNRRVHFCPPARVVAVPGYGDGIGISMFTLGSSSVPPPHFGILPPHPPPRPGVVLQVFYYSVMVRFTRNGFLQFQDLFAVREAHQEYVSSPASPRSAAAVERLII